jgi:peptidoglycan hydrolase-like protein with peptidoglycan-binding domain
MSLISVDTEALKDIEKRFGTLSKKLGQTESSLKSIRSNLDSDIKKRNGIDSKLQNLIKELDEEERVLNQVTQFLSKTIKQYQDIEKSMQNKVNEINGDTKTKTNIFSKILDAAISSLRKKVEIIQKIISLPVIIGSTIIGNTVIKGIGDILSKEGNEVTNEPVEEKKEKTDDSSIPPLSGVLSYNPNVYSEEVLMLQRRLNEIYAGVSGYKKIKEDGYFGPETLAAVNRYKEEHGLWNFGEYEGKVGETTWNHMFGIKIEERSGQPEVNTVDDQKNDKSAVVNTQGTGSPVPLPPDSYSNNQVAQYYLNAMGFDIGTNKEGKPLIDGIMGVKSSAAIIIFQYSQGLHITGVADTTTLEKLRECANSGVTYNSIMGSDVINNWKPGTPTISRDKETNGFLDEYNMVRLPTVSCADAYAERETAIAWSMMVNGAMEYNKTADKKLNINSFSLTGPNSGYRSYHMQVEAYIKWQHLDGNEAADVGKNWKDPAKAKQWIESNKKNFGKNGSWNNVPDDVTAVGGALEGYGASDHGWGLALDMNLGNGENCVASTAEVLWLESNASKYGFTGYVNGKDKYGRTVYAETWHWYYMK